MGRTAGESDVSRRRLFCIYVDAQQRMIFRPLLRIPDRQPAKTYRLCDYNCSPQSRHSWRSEAGRSTTLPHDFLAVEEKNLRIAQWPPWATRRAAYFGRVIASVKRQSEPADDSERPLCSAWNDCIW
jgi:hypothetical protein